MEQHPVPQNVTTFQFRLVGDMTLKQVGYLAAGFIAAYIIFKSPLPFFFKYPLVLIFGLGGIGFAFVPIENRPMDTWVFSFFKRVYSPTKYIWQQSKTTIQPAAQPTQTKVATATQNNAPRPSPPKPSGSFVTSLKSMLTQNKSKQTHTEQKPPMQQNAGQTQKPIQQQLKQQKPQQAQKTQQVVKPYISPKSEETQTTPEPKVPVNTEKKQYTQEENEQKEKEQVVQQKKSDEAQQKIEALQKKVASLESYNKDSSQTEKRLQEIQTQLQEALSQRKRAEEELLRLKKEYEKKPEPGGQTFEAATTQEVSKKPTVRIIAPDAAKSAGLPTLTTHPNVVTGIVKDAEGGLLPGVLATIRDQDDVPLRALKTNKLGQFAASTPLNNGTYIIEIEDPRGRFLFDRAQVSLEGNIIPPIEITAKSQKQMNRAMLEKQIFGDNTAS